MLYLPSGHPRGHVGGVLSDTGGEWMFVSISTEQSSSVQYLHMTMDSFNFPLSKVVDGPKKLLHAVLFLHYPSSILVPSTLLCN